MFRDAYDAGDMRVAGQQFGKLTTDLAQMVGGVEALVRMAPSLARGVGRGANAVAGVFEDTLAGSGSGTRGLGGQRGSVGVSGAPMGGGSGLINAEDIAELTARGVKFTPENIVATGRTPSGQVVFLESGSSRAGLQHIFEQHGDEFARIGVERDQIASVVMSAVEFGKVIGYQGTGQGRVIYEVTIRGQPQRIAVTTGSNGFIVGANPAGSIK